MDGILYWLSLRDCSFRPLSCLPFPAKRATITFSVAKLVQAASCKYQMPYSLDFFKNYFADGLAAGKNFSLPHG